MKWRIAILIMLVLTCRVASAAATLFQPDDAFTRFFRDLSQAIDKQDRDAVMALVANNFTYERDPDGVFDSRLSGKENFSKIFLPEQMPEEFRKGVWANLHKTVEPHLLFTSHWGVCPAPLPSLETLSKSRDMHFLASAREPKARLRAAPNLNAPILHEISNGDMMVVGSVRGQKIRMSNKSNILTSSPDLWFKVIYKDFPEAYIHSSLLSFWEEPRFCFAKRGGEWQITSFVNGAPASTPK